MQRIRTGALLLLAASLLFVSFHAERAGAGSADDRNPKEPVQDFAKLKRGMTPEEVRQWVGTPQRVAREILYHRYREQWLYETPRPIRLTFECLRGQKPQLLAVPALPNEKGR